MTKWKIDGSRSFFRVLLSFYGRHLPVIEQRRYAEAVFLHQGESLSFAESPQNLLSQSHSGSVSVSSLSSANSADYLLIDDTFTFDPFESTTTIRVTILNDQVTESLENLILTPEIWETGLIRAYCFSMQNLRSGPLKQDRIREKAGRYLQMQ